MRAARNPNQAIHRQPPDPTPLYRRRVRWCRVYRGNSKHPMPRPEYAALVARILEREANLAPHERELLEALGWL